MESNRQSLLNAIQMYAFYLYELQLYLDSHPTCTNALNAFRKYKQLHCSAVAAYNRSFGPITAADSDCTEVFEWAKGPWPWEKEAN